MKKLSDTPLYIGRNSKPIVKRISKSSMSNKNNKKSLFDSVNLEDETEMYNFSSLASGDSRHMLSLMNPCLLAYRNTIQNSSRNLSRDSSSKIIRNTSGTITKPLVELEHDHNPLPFTSLISKRPHTVCRRTLTVFERMEIAEKNEEATISFKDDPIAYFNKKKDGSGHRFIYLIHTRSRDDPYFSPYDLVKTTTKGIGKEYFTISATGITHIMQDGSTCTISLDEWVHQSSSFAALKKLKFFRQYLLWKPFKVWKIQSIRQRYDDLAINVKKIPFFYSPSFATTLQKIIMTAVDPSKKFYITPVLKRYLLPFYPYKSYVLEVFNAINQENIYSLRQIYDEYIAELTKLLLSLDFVIRDPSTLFVKDSDVKKMQRKNTNPDLMVVLERKRAEIRVKRTEKVNEEIIKFGHFIRQIDYILLEDLAAGLIETWNVALFNFSQKQSSMFQLEVTFGLEGEVVLTPSLSDLLSVIVETLRNSISLLNNLPRIIIQESIIAHIKQSYPNFTDLLRKGPDLVLILNSYKEIEEIEQKIVEITKCSYEEAQRGCVVFADLYPIYQLRESMSSETYIGTRTGKQPVDLEEVPDNSDYIVDFEREPFVDLIKVKKDIELFLSFKKKLKRFSPYSIAGCLYIEYKSLRKVLEHIPDKRLEEVFDILHMLLDGKSQRMTLMFSNLIEKMKVIPSSLEEYVNLCLLVTRAKGIYNDTENEISYIDDIFHLLVFYQAIKESSSIQSNSLHSQFSLFSSTLNSASENVRCHRDMFLNELVPKADLCKKRLLEYTDDILKVSTSIEKCNIRQLLSQLDEARKKTAQLTPEINKLKDYQQVLNTNVSDFSQLAVLKNTINFATSLCETVDQWNKIEASFLGNIFVLVDIDQFNESMMQLETNVHMLSTMIKTPIPLLDELSLRLKTILPYLSQLKLLKSKGIQERHWHKLFQECKIETIYRSDIRLDEVLDCGIMEYPEKIEEVCDIVHGEQEFEKQFNEIQSKWNKISIPLLPNQPKLDDNIIIINTSDLITQIEEEINSLSKMVLLPFASGVEDKVNNLQGQLRNVRHILYEWWSFQCNWSLIHSLFTDKSNKNVLNDQISRYQSIRKKWSAVVEYVQKNSSLLSLCKFPNLANYIYKCNTIAAGIIDSLDPYIQAKLKAVPRLFMLGNDDILALSMIPDKRTISRIISRLFMNVKHVIFSDDNDFKINGLMGEDGHKFFFTRPVPVVGSIEQWTNLMFIQMKETMQIRVASMLAKKSENLNDWIGSTPTHLVNIALCLFFSVHLTNCIDSVDDIIRDINTYADHLASQMSQISNYINHSTSVAEKASFRTAIITLSNQISFLNHLRSSRDPKMEWFLAPKYIFDSYNNNLIVSMGLESIEFRYEYNGLVIPEVSTHTTRAVIKNLFIHPNPMVIGSVGSGRKMIIKSAASFLGVPYFIVPAFKTLSITQLQRIVFGAAHSNTWCVFNDIQFITPQNSAFIYDFTRALEAELVSGGTMFNFTEETFKITPGVKFLFTGDGTFGKVVPQLSCSVHPVSLSDISFQTVLCTRLISHGFSSAETPSLKLRVFLESFLSIFNHKLRMQSFMYHAIRIIEMASEIRIFALANEITFSAENRGSFEEFIVAFSAYRYTNIFIESSQNDILIGLLYNIFKTFDDSGQFKTRITQEIRFSYDVVSSLINTTLLRKFDDHSDLLQSCYIEKCIKFYTATKLFDIIILYGLPWSGKRKTIDLTVEALNDCLQDETWSKSLKVSQLPFRVHRIYHRAGSWTHIYGGVKDGKWVRGVAQMIIEKILLEMDGAHHELLILDGPIDADVDRFIGQLISQKKSFISSMDVFDFTENITIVISSDNIDCVSESTGKGAAFIEFQWIYHSDPHNFVNMPVCIPSEIEDIFHENYYRIMQQLTKISSGELTKNNSILYYTFLNYLASFLHALNIESSNVTHINNAMAIGACKFLYGTIEEENYNNFEEWIRLSFSLQSTDIEFDESSTNPGILNIYTKPPLAIFSPDEVPTLYSFDELNEFIFTSSVSNDIFIITAEMFICYKTMSLLINSGQNVLIVGKTQKSVLIEYFFTLHQNYSLFIIDISYNSSVEIITHHILNIYEKAAIKEDSSIVIVFTHVDRGIFSVQEFIRQIISSREIATMSTTNVGKLKIIKLKNTQFVLSVDSLSGIKSRISDKVPPVFISLPNIKTVTFITESLLIKYGVDKAFVDKFVNVVVDVFPAINKIRFVIWLVKILSRLHNKEAKSPSDELNMAYVMFYELRLMGVECSEVFAKYFEGFSPNSMNDRQNLFFVSRKNESSSDLTLFGQSYSVSEITNKLTRYVRQFNTKSSEKISLLFYSSLEYKWSCMQHCFSNPNCHLLLVGSQCSCRYSLTRITANMCQCDFIYITTPIYDNIAAVKTIKEVIVNTSLYSKKSVIFVRANKDDSTEFIRRLISFSSNYDFTEFFDAASIEDFYNKIYDILGMDESQYFDATRIIRDFLLQNMHIVIAVEDITYCPKWENKRIIEFEEPSEGDMEEIASRLILSDANKQVLGPFTPIFPKLLRRLYEIAVKNIDYCKLPYFIDFIALFNNILVSNYNKEILFTNEKMIAEKVIETILDEKLKLSAKIDTRRPIINNLRNAIENHKSQTKARRDAINGLKKKQSIGKKEKLDTLNKLEMKLTNAKNTFAALTKDVMRYQTDVEGLTDDDVRTLRINSENPSPVFQKTFELICVYLKLHFSFQMAGLGLLHDDKFIPTILSGIRYEYVDESILKSAQIYYQDPTFTHKAAGDDSPALETLFDWLKAITDYSLCKRDVELLSESFRDYSADYELFSSELDYQLGNIEEHERTLVKDDERLKEIQTNYDKEEKVISEWCETLGIYMSALDDSDSLLLKWHEDIQQITNSNNKIILNSVLFSFYISFLGLVPKEIRKKIVDEAIQELSTFGLSCNYERPISDIKTLMFENVNLPVVPIIGFYKVFSIIAHADFCRRVPLVFDPDNSIHVALTSMFKHTEIKVISLLASDFETQLLDAVRIGSRILVLDADFYHPALAGIMSMYQVRSDPDVAPIVTISTKITEWSNKCKLVLITSKKHISELPHNFVCRVTIINAKRESSQATQKNIESIFVQHCDHPTYERIETTQIPNARVRANVKYLEKDLVHSFSSIFESFNGKALYKSLTEEWIASLRYKRNEFFKAQKMCEELPSEKALTIVPKGKYDPPLTSGIIFWRVITDGLVRLSPLYYMQFSVYSDILASIFKTPDLIKDDIQQETLVIMDNMITKNVLSDVLPTLSFNSSIVFLAMVALETSLHKGNISDKDYEEILRQLSSLSNSPYKESTSEHIGDPFVQIRSSNPVDAYNTIEKIITTRFGPYWSSLLQPFQLDNIVSSRSSIPSFIYTDNGSPSSDIISLNFIKPKEECFEEITLTSSFKSGVLVSKIVSAASIKGTRVLVHCSENTLETCIMIADLCKLCTTLRSSKNFRLVICLSCSLDIPQNIISIAKRISCENTPLLRHQMYNLFNFVSTTLEVSLNHKVIQKCAYGVCVAFSILLQRKILGPQGFLNHIRLDSITLIRFIYYIQQIINFRNHNFTVHSLGDALFDNFIGTQVISHVDKGVIRSLIFTIFTQNMFNDGFTYCPNTPDSEMFALSPDGSINCFLESTGKLPLFASPNSLLMQHSIAYPLRNFAISRGVTRLFWCFNKFSDYSVITGNINIARLRAKNLPNPVKQQTHPPTNATQVVFQNEVTLFNRLLQIIKDQCNTELLHPNAYIFSKDKVPDEWAQMISYRMKGDARSFLNHLNDRRDFLTEWLENSKINVLKPYLVTNIRGLLSAYLCQIAESKGISCDEACFTFDTNPNPSLMRITGLYTSGCKWNSEEQKLDIDAQTPPFYSFPEMTLNVVRKGKLLQNLFNLPVLITAKVNDNPPYFGVVNEDSSNILCYIPVATDISHSTLTSNGAVLFCSVPEDFKLS